ncbi:hypothetical protein FOL47_002204 [Perkinsus chesapeaki]|uniref:Uncharacterized protein n=1 Tax=Perkinsus chesapeaki TaxID=330153 RepID=A0A7J6KPT3_PERCH|nr:hypothetical protein FOL47_002204 [Perkinsus chesapeaki]
MPAKSPQVENVPKTPQEITPPAWAFDLKQQLNEIQQQQAGLVDVDTLEKGMDKLSLTVENLVEKLEHDTEVGQKEDSGNGYDSGTGASKGSTSGKDSNSPRNCGHDVDDKIDIIKISKRAAYWLFCSS